MASERLTPLIARQEGFSADVYRDSLGFWTVGYGHLVSRDKTLTADQARALCGAPWLHERAWEQLKKHIASVEREIDATWGWAVSLPPLVRDGLIDMAYQLGVGGVKGFPRMLTALKAGDYAAAERHALQSVWAKEQTPSRAAEVAGMLGNRVFPKV